MTLGVIIARFQVPELSLGHKYLINSALDRYDEVGFLLGVCGQNRANPLNFTMREQMVREWMVKMPPRFIAPVFDCPGDNKAWSEQVDKLLDIYASVAETISLVGGRDSFIPSYMGKHGAYYIEQLPFAVASLCGTEIREQVGIANSADFRRGVIWQVFNGR